jgi:hypothetical protein
MAQRRTEVEVVSGVLQRLTNPNVSEMQNKQDVYSQLNWFADQQGYKPGWVKHKYKEIFGVWPRLMKDTKTTPSQELLNWIRHKQIAYAKRRNP